MPNVLISYARPDIDFARRLFRELKKIETVEPWFDEHSLLPGIKWRSATCTHLVESLKLRENNEARALNPGPHPMRRPRD
jgi:hypothetical protein